MRHSDSDNRIMHLFLPLLHGSMCLGCSMLVLRLSRRVCLLYMRTTMHMKLRWSCCWQCRLLLLLLVIIVTR